MIYDILLLPKDTSHCWRRLSTGCDSCSTGTLDWEIWRVYIYSPPLESTFHSSLLWKWIKILAGEWGDLLILQLQREISYVRSLGYWNCHILIWSCLPLSSVSPYPTSYEPKIILVEMSRQQSDDKQIVYNIEW